MKTSKPIYVFIPIIILLAATLACGKSTSTPRDAADPGPVEVEAENIEPAADPGMEESADEEPESDSPPADPAVATLAAAAGAAASDTSGPSSSSTGAGDPAIPAIPAQREFTSIEDPQETGNPEDIVEYSAAVDGRNAYFSLEFVGPLEEFISLDYRWDPSSPDFDFFDTNYSGTGGGTIFLNGSGESQLKITFGTAGYVLVRIDDDYDGINDRELGSYYYYALNDRTILIVLPLDLFEFHQAQSWVALHLYNQEDLVPDRYMVEKYRLVIP